MRAPFFVVAVGLVMAGSALAQAQASTAPTQSPQLVTTGHGEVELKPDRAQLIFSVETRASSAAAATASNSRLQRAVLDTLKRLGVGDDQLQTAALQVHPEFVYPGQGQPPRVSGYVARNSVRVEVMKLEMTGPLVDAGLAKGATGIGGLSFHSSKATEARREAMAKAVVAARLDAEAMAKAAGVQLGALVEIVASPGVDRPSLRYDVGERSARLALAQAPVPIEAGELKISESVTVRWALRP